MKMSGTLKRRRGLIFKVIVGVPILWFSFIGFTVVMSGGGDFPPETGVGVGVRQADGGAGVDFGGSDRNQPAVEDPGSMRAADTGAVRTRKTFFPHIDHNNNMEPPHADGGSHLRGAENQQSTGNFKGTKSPGPPKPDVPKEVDDPTGPGRCTLLLL